MESKKLMPKLLYVDQSEGDLKNGIKFGYYPELKAPIENGSLVVITPKESKKYRLMTPPVGNGMDFYVSNPSSQNYLSLWDVETPRILISDKSFAVKEALVWMGAKDIVLVQNAVDTDNTNIDLKNQAALELANADIKADYNRSMSFNLKSSIESHDINRRPKPAEKVEEFMRLHGLGNDVSLLMLLSRLKEDGELHGTETYEVVFLNEMQNALNVAANINYKVFNDTLDFSRKRNHVKTITRTIRINYN